MKNNIWFTKGLCQVALTACIALFGMQAAHANDFAITSGGVEGRFNLSNDLGFSTNASIGSDAQVTLIQNVPLTASFGIPNFSFTLVNAATTPVAGTYVFRVGVAVSHTTSNRRFEAVIQNLTLNVNGTAVTGTIPAQNMAVAGRVNTVLVDATINNAADNGPVFVSNASGGGTVTFSGSRLVDRVKSSNTFFDPVFNAFNVGGGTYNYSIVIEQVSGPGDTRFGVRIGSPAAFTSFPRAAQNAAFELSNFNTQFNSALGYRLQGQFTTAEATTTPPAPAPVVPTVPAQTVLATTAAAQGFESSASAAGFSAETFTNLNSTTAAVAALTNLVEAGAALTPAQQESVKSVASSVLNTSLNLINNAPPTVTTAQIEQLAQGVNKLIEDAGKAGVAADATLVTQAVNVGQATTIALLRQSVGANATNEQITAAVAADPTLLENALRVATRVPATIVRNVTTVRNTLPTQVATEVANRLASSLATVLNPDNFTLSGGQTLTSLLAGFLSGTQQLSELAFISDERTATIMALTAGNVSITTDPVSGTVILSLPGESYAGSITAVRSVSTVLPNSIRIRRNGTGIIVFNGIAVEISPVALSTVSFALAVENAGFQYGFRSSDAVLRIELGGGERFAGVFAYDNLTGKNLDPASCGAITIVEPVIEPKLPAYAFGVNCASGVQQRVVPYIDFDNFFASLDAKSTNYAVDRNTGFVTITGTGVFKPSFFVSPLTAADQTFHAANKDSFGVALQAIDINSDGKMDFKVIATNGVQVLYGTN